MLDITERRSHGASYPMIARKLCRKASPMTFKMAQVEENRDYGQLLAKVMNDVNTGGINVMFTPGRYNAAFFEHSYLAEQTGSVLAFPSDLEVEGEHLYYKTYNGKKELVGAIYRRVSDEYLDPMEFCKDSLIGIPHLMEVYRKGNVVVINTPGNGIADDKGIYYFVPKMIEYYLGEKPILHNAPTYLPFYEEDREYVLKKDVVSELTYDEIDKSIENLWSVLFTTGYLTHKGCTESGKYRLVIPNKEVRNLFVKKIREWFSDVSRNDEKTLEEFCSAFVDKDSEKIEQIFGDYLWNTISIRDTAVAKEKKENFYHGILLGLLGYKSNWLIKSNAESGIGYSDILVEVPTNRTGIVIEIKYAEDGNLDAACEKALKQIEEKDYVAKLKQDGMKNFIKYGIACFKKICKVKVE